MAREGVWKAVGGFWVEECGLGWVRGVEGLERHYDGQKGVFYYLYFYCVPKT